MKQGRWANGVLVDLKYLKLDEVKDVLLPKKILKEDFRKELKIDRGKV